MSAGSNVIKDTTDMKTA